MEKKFEMERQIIANREMEVEYCKARWGKCIDDEKGECPFLKQFEGCVLDVTKPYAWNKEIAENLLSARERWTD